MRRFTLPTLLCLLLVSAGCRNSQHIDGHVPLPDPRPNLHFVTRSMINITASGTISGVLEERDDCLRIVAEDGTDYVIAWPTGAIQSMGVGMDPPVAIAHFEEDGSPENFQVFVGDTLRLYGGRAPDTDPVRGCDGPVWVTDGRIDALARVPEQQPPPTAAPDELGELALQSLEPFYDTEFNAPTGVLLSLQLSATEVHNLAGRFPPQMGVPVGVTPCGEEQVPERWYCDPAAVPWLVIVQGGWWLHDANGERFTTYAGVLWDRRPDQPVMIRYGDFLTCDLAQFGALLDDVPFATPVPLPQDFGC